MRTRMIRAVVSALLVLTASAAFAGDWPAWRGPTGLGVADDAGVPVEWSPDRNIHWKAAIPGSGHSSPVIVGDRIFLTSAIEENELRVLTCLDRHTGKAIWQREVLRASLEGKHGLNSYASATPATDGKHVWVSFLQKPEIKLICFDMEGNEVWRKTPGTFSSVHGFCSSPVLFNDLVILNCDQDAPAWIVAYDKASGQERWRVDRPNRVRSYCTPTIIDVDGKKQLVLSGSRSVASYDPATGKQNWLIDGPTDQFVASPVYTDRVLFITGGFPELHVLGIKPDGSGNVTKTHILWRDHRGVSYVPSPVARDRWFFLVADNGIASCFEAKTGKVLWKERLGRRHSASGIVAGGNAYFIDDDGNTFVFSAGPDFKLIGENALGESCFASPAVAQGQLFVRTARHLWCIGEGEKK